MIHYLRVWKRDARYGGYWAIADEDGRLEIHNALKLLAAKKTSGPRFADTQKGEVAKDRTPTPGLIERQAESGLFEQQAESGCRVGVVIEDERSIEHIMADGFAQIVHNALTANPSIVPDRAGHQERVIVQGAVLTDRVKNGPDTAPTGSAILEETLSTITLGKLKEYLCAGGTVRVVLDENGQLLDVGPDQRLFTKAQRTRLGVHDVVCCGDFGRWAFLK